MQLQPLFILPDKYNFIRLRLPMIQKPQTLKRYAVSEIFFIYMLSKLTQLFLIVSTGKIKLPIMKL